LVCPDCEQLAKRVAFLEKENRELRKQLKHLMAVIAERLPQFAKPETETKPAKPSGRPEGHEGVGRPTPEQIDKQVKLAPITTCPDCGKPVQIKRVRKRVITILVPGKIENTEYEIPQGYCGNCHQPVEPTVPNALPNSRFDLTLALWMACLRMLGVSVDKIRFLLQTDYSLKISSATVVNTCNKLAEFLGEDYEQLRKELVKEKSVHGDETGWRTKGKRRWLWEFISKNTAYFTIRNTRAHEVPVEVMRGFKGVFSSDFWNAYNFLECEKQKCWVHLKRELDKVLKYRHSKEFARFASKLMQLFYWAKSERNHGAKTRAFAEKRLQALLSQDYRNEDCKRLVKTLSRYQNELFTFCARRGVETDNNHAERGIRPAVVIRKISFGSQSDRGAQTTSVLMSFFQTARLREENFTEFMQEMAQNRLQN
jgi:ssDNA-binding Zn-finger/Zn-ribbon topoisomerase 1